MVGGFGGRSERGIEVGRGVSGRGGKSAMEEVEGTGARDKDEVEEVEDEEGGVVMVGGVKVKENEDGGDDDGMDSEGGNKEER